MHSSSHHGFGDVRIDESLVAIAEKKGHQVLKALLELPKKLRDSPAAKGVDLEFYEGALDSCFRTTRLTDAWRAFIWQLDGETLYVWDIGTHEDARRESKRKRCKVDQVTHALRIVDVPTETEEELSQQIQNPPLVPSHIRDRELRDLGVPEKLIPIVRLLHTEDDLEALNFLIPQHEAALLAVAELAQGKSPAEVRDAMSAFPTASADGNDFRSALIRSIERGRIRVLNSETEVASALKAPWDHWKFFLHPSQRQIAYKHVFAGPCKVTGGPGTGKTVVALHRLKHLLDAEQSGMFETPRPLLLTTFVRSTAAALEANATALIGAELLAQRVHVRSIDSLISDLLRELAPSEPLGNPLKDEAVARRFEPVLHSRGIQIEPLVAVKEWEQVILAANDGSWEQAHAFRAEGLPLGVHTKRAYELLVAAARDVEKQLSESGETTFLLRCRRLLDLLPSASRYQHVIIDEAQDMHPLHWRLIRRLVDSGPNDIFFVGDSDQRLYRRPYSLAALGINSRGRSHKLKLNYRCSADVLRFACGILNEDAYDDLDDARTTREIPISVFESVPPVTASADNEEQEAEKLSAQVRRWNREGVQWSEMLVTAPSRRRVGEIAQHFGAVGIPAVVLDEKRGQDGKGVSVVTYHRAKGLEARAVAVVGAGTHFWPGDGYRDQRTSSDNEDEVRRRGRAPLFVACTRARERLLVSWVGSPSPLLTRSLASLDPR